MGSEMRYKWVCQTFCQQLPTHLERASSQRKSPRRETMMMDQEMGQDLTKHHHIIHDYCTPFFALICSTLNNLPSSKDFATEIHPFEPALWKHWKMKQIKRRYNTVAHYVKNPTLSQKVDFKETFLYIWNIWIKSP